jgi:hypothetical protein
MFWLRVILPICFSFSRSSVIGFAPVPSGDSFALAMNPSRDMDMYRTVADTASPFET